MSAARDDSPDPLAALVEDLRARGAARFDPVRFRQIEAMARRAVAYRGIARRLLDEKLARLIAATTSRLDARSPGAPPAAPGPAAPRDTLAALLADVARHTASPTAGSTSATPGARAPVELKSIRNFRGTWSQLKVDRRLTQSRATVPANAGPLNTQRLLHQAMTAMQEASPAYLQAFMAHVEALVWLDDANVASSGASPAKKDGARSTRPGKPGGSRPG